MSQQAELESLGRALRSLGYLFREAPFFGPNGIMVFRPAHDPTDVVEHPVFAYADHTS